jgi:hypothetical protein
MKEKEPARLGYWNEDKGSRLEDVADRCGTAQNVKGGQI